MKKVSVQLLAGLSLFLLTSFSLFGQEPQKVFLDRDLKKIDYEDFASYYRVELKSSSSQIITYRLFSKAGILLSEGKAVSFDNDDYSKNIYIGENLCYYENGEVEGIRFFDNPGTVDDSFHLEKYDEQERLIERGTVNNGKFSGERFIYEDDCLRQHLVFENDNLNGVCELFYSNGSIESSMTMENGIKNGPYISYFPTGETKQTATFVNDLMEGDWTEYNEHGRTTISAQQKNGILVGDLVYYHLENKNVYHWYEMTINDPSPLFISVSPLLHEYTTTSRNVKTIGGKKVDTDRDRCNLLRFDMQIRNTNNEPIVFSIQDINIISLGKKGRVEGKNYPNYAISSEDAKAMCVNHIKYERELAIKNAQKKAKNMATTTTTSQTVGHANNYSKTNAVGTTARVGAGYGAAVGNGGRYAVGAGANASVSAAASTTRQYSTSYGISSTSAQSFDNAVYYQTLNDEIQKANSYIESLKESSEEEIKQLEMKNISIPAKGYVSKKILAPEVGGDFIVLEFTINGVFYYFMIAEDSIPNYYGNY